MASDKKKVTLEVAVETEQAQIAALEKKLDEAKQKAAELKQQKIQMQVNADTQKLSEVKSKIKELENQRANLKVGVDDAEIEQTEAEIAKLKQQQINLELNIEKSKLDDIKSEMDAIEADPIEVQLNNQSAMEGIQQIADGFSRVKSAAGEVAGEFGDLLASAGKQETNFAFLKNAVGDAETARQKMSEINDIVAQLPGDDTALQGLLSSAAAKDSSLTADNLRSMANSATDYFSAMSYYGKSATEAQQDMTNYLLAGNTAELERSPILQGHIDKLKEATTVQERSQALAEALNEEHWGGMGAMDTYNNKLETFNGMIERGRYTLGGMFQEGAKSGMDFLLKLDESTNGLVGMTIAAGGFLSPVTDAVMGLGQMATGIKAIKDAADFSGIIGKLGTIKTKALEAASTLKSTLVGALKGVASAAKSAASWLATTSKELLISAANALRSAAAWAAEKAAKLASAIASGVMTAAQWLLNAAMAANPVTLIVIAIVALVAILWYLYNTCEPVRNAIDGIWAGVSGAIQPIIDDVQWLIDKLTQLCNGDWTVTIEIVKAGVDKGIETGLGLANNDISRGIVSMLLGDEALAQVDEAMPAFQEKLTTSINDMLDAMWNDGTQGLLGWLGQVGGIDVGGYLTGFSNSFAQIPLWVQQAGQGAIQGFQQMFVGITGWLNSIIGNVGSFASNLVSKFRTAASNAVTGFINNIKALPGALAGELQAMYNQAVNWLNRIVDKVREAAQRMVEVWKWGSGEQSPGFMYDAFHGELKAMESAAKSIRVPGLMGQAGQDMVQAWGNPKLSYSMELDQVDVDQKGAFDNSRLESLLSRILDAINNRPIGPGNVTLNHYGDTDKEEKLNEILDFIVKQMNFDNATAGRTV